MYLHPLPDFKPKGLSEKTRAQFLAVESGRELASHYRRVLIVRTSGPRTNRIQCEHKPSLSHQTATDRSHSKHERKHTKPFKCKFPECAAKGVGFSTENDRDRHYKSGRHNLAPEKGAKKGYICIACPPAAGGEPKWWPRQDNFKAHCSRKHPNWGSLDDLIRR